MGEAFESVKGRLNLTGGSFEVINNYTLIAKSADGYKLVQEINGKIYHSQTFYKCETAKLTIGDEIIVRAAIKYGMSIKEFQGAPFIKRGRFIVKEFKSKTPELKFKPFRFGLYNRKGALTYAVDRNSIAMYGRYKWRKLDGESLLSSLYGVVDIESNIVVPFAFRSLRTDIDTAQLSTFRNRVWTEMVNCNSDGYNRLSVEDIKRIYEGKASLTESCTCDVSKITDLEMSKLLKADRVLGAIQRIINYSTNEVYKGIVLYKLTRDYDILKFCNIDSNVLAVVIIGNTRTREVYRMIIRKDTDEITLF